MGILYETVHIKGANIVGSWPTDGYEFDESRAMVNGNFVGLALDNDNQLDRTPQRIEQWAGQLKNLFQ